MLQSSSYASRRPTKWPMARTPFTLTRQIPSSTFSCMMVSRCPSPASRVEATQRTPKSFEETRQWTGPFSRKWSGYNFSLNPLSQRPPVPCLRLKSLATTVASLAIWHGIVDNARKRAKVDLPARLNNPRQDKCAARDRNQVTAMRLLRSKMCQPRRASSTPTRIRSQYGMPFVTKL